MATDSTLGVSGVSVQNTNAAKIDKQLFGAALVKTTLDTLNSDPHRESGKNADYDFQTKVLEGGLMAKGTLVAGKV